MSYTQTQLANITNMALQLQNDPALALQFAQHMLTRYPREALRFGKPATQFTTVEIDGVTVTPEIQLWLHQNAEKYNNYNTPIGQYTSTKIEAIKELRTVFKSGLREAKIAVEGYPYRKA